jgi:hypothetical protein
VRTTEVRLSAETLTEIGSRSSSFTGVQADWPEATVLAHRSAADVPALLAYVAHLESAVDEYREVIEAHHADFRAVKVAVTQGLQAPTALDCAGQIEWARRALTEIDRIVL